MRVFGRDVRSIPRDELRRRFAVVPQDVFLFPGTVATNIAAGDPTPDRAKVEQALAKSRRDGIQYGIAINCGKGFPVQDDAGALRFLESMRGQPVFWAMQAEGREWTQMFSARAVSQFDYVFTDSMTWTDKSFHSPRNSCTDLVKGDNCSSLSC